MSGTWKTNLTPDKLGVVALDPDALSISGLQNYVNYLISSGQYAGRYQLNMWSKLFQPLSVAVMMLMALSFIFGPLRSVPLGVRVVTGIRFGFVFYVLDQIFGPLTLALSISGLQNYVNYLISSGQYAGRYQLNMWSKLFQPLSVAVMMLMALSFIFGPLRSVPLGVRVVTGIRFGFVFYVLDQIFGPLTLVYGIPPIIGALLHQIFGPLTLVYGIPPIIGALLPSASFFLISLWLLMRKRSSAHCCQAPASS